MQTVEAKKAVADVDTGIYEPLKLPAEIGVAPSGIYR